MPNTPNNQDAARDAGQETYSVIQVKGGKFHRPKVTTLNRMAWFKPMETECGITVSPLNVFQSVADATSYTGGNTTHLCQKCIVPATAETVKYTPGPWYSSRTGNHQGLVISEATSENVAVTYNGAADACLVAAAPELLAALEQIAKWVDCGCDPSRKSMDAARAAIAKAKGGAQ